MNTIKLRTVRLSQLHEEAKSLKIASPEIIFPMFIGNTAEVAGLFESRVTRKPLSLDDRTGAKHYGHFYDIASPRSPMIEREAAGFIPQAPCPEHSGSLQAYGKYQPVTATIVELDKPVSEIAPPEQQYCSEIDNISGPIHLEPYNPRADKIFSLLGKLTR